MAAKTIRAYHSDLAHISALIVATWFLLLPVLDGALAVWLLWLAERGY